MTCASWVPPRQRILGGDSAPAPEPSCRDAFCSNTKQVFPERTAEELVSDVPYNSTNRVRDPFAWVARPAELTQIIGVLAKFQQPLFAAEFA